MSTVRRTQKQRREEAEAALLEAAAELVDEQGVGALTLVRVGERAGYSRGLVTHYFGSKQALVERLAGSAQAGFVPGLEGLPPGLDRLLRLIDGYIGELGRMGVLNRVFLKLWSEAPSLADLTPVLRERNDAFLADVEEDLAAGIAEGTIRADVAPGPTAIAVVAQLRGIGVHRMVDPGRVDTEVLRTHVTGHWRRALTRT